MSYEGYCEIASIKQRLLIDPADETYDDALEYAGTEASRMIDEKIRPYKSPDTEEYEESKEPFVFKTLPITAEIIPDILKEICADIGAGLFKRRMKPGDFDQGWLNQGLTKLAEFIKANWFKGKFAFSTTQAEQEAEESWMEKLFNLLDEIKGTGWTDETLKAIYDLITGGGVDPQVLAKAVWEYATRTLTTSVALEATAQAIKAKTDTIDWNEVATIISEIQNGTYGLSALQVLLDALPTLTEIEASTVLAKDATVAKEATLNTKASQTSVDKKICKMDFWSKDKAIVTLTAGGESGVVALPSVTVNLPTGVTIFRVVALLKVALIRDTSGSDNAVDVATGHVEVRSDAPGTWTQAIDIEDNEWAVDVSSSPDRGGDVIPGDTDIKAEVDENDTYEFELDDLGVDGDSLLLLDVQTGLRIYFY